MTGPFVLDCSVVLAVLLPDEQSPQAQDVIGSMAASRASVPQHWALEVANGLLMAVRRRRIDDEFRRGAIEDAASLPVEVANDTSAWAWSALSDLAIRHSLTIYDAAYLELARRRRLPLATLDRRLTAAASAEGVKLIL